MTHILIVDDSPGQVEKMRNILETNGYTVSDAGDGEEALRKARKSKPKPDLILMDVVMPGISGFQATRKLSKLPETRDIPVIIVSSKGEETDKIWGKRQGAKDYLVKAEVDESVLLETISKALSC